MIDFESLEMVVSITQFCAKLWGHSCFRRQVSMSLSWRSYFGKYAKGESEAALGAEDARKLRAADFTRARPSLADVWVEAFLAAPNSTCGLFASTIAPVSFRATVTVVLAETLDIVRRPEVGIVQMAKT
jgi:hypothetical protein